ncbi:hypothetical protein L3Q72_14525 [Vibrio sp. JC009]|uniref:hypothetical protein n=1 Tax=Vibrio sp. JC009 TaxID=2912314 RepID=UPI0023B0AAD3|nr:hypothetical protein [Vibrio sp. JC009]WED21786.1 hypothetical protein L3Q72_14525 [Vibrio sp. JC009]
MERRLLSYIFLICLSWNVFASGVEMSPNTRQMWLQNEVVQQKTKEFYKYADKDKVDTIIYEMETLTQPEQEAIRFLLLQSMEQQKMPLTGKLAGYIESLLKTPPVYQMNHVGDGYEFTTPAFAYPAVANRLLNVWKQDQKILQFVLAAEREELHLETWLNDGTEKERLAREQLFIAELDGLSPPALNLIVEQVVDAENRLIFWLPSNPVMVRLAQVSEDPRVYKLLWRMRATSESQKELFRLMDKEDPASVDIIIDATNNPKLQIDAIQYLASYQPRSGVIKAFFIDKLSSKNQSEVDFVANELVRQGYSDWLKTLLETNDEVNKAVIQKALEE